MTLYKFFYQVLLATNVAPSERANGVPDNVISMPANGLQASFNFGMFSNRNFNWDFTTNISHQTFEIDKIKGPDIVLSTSAAAPI